jgi:ketosteroid isomerase-like protein
MSAVENRQVIVEHFAAKERRDESALRNQFSQDVKWWAPKSTEKRGIARPVSGRDNVLALLMSLGFYKPEGRVWTIHHLVADDRTVAAHVTFETETVNGHPYENQYVFIFEMRDGRIAQAWEHLDTAHTYSLLDS